MSEPSPMKKPWTWPFDRGDGIVAGIAWLAAQTLYFFTAQPNVGLLDAVS